MSVNIPSLSLSVLSHSSVSMVLTQWTEANMGESGNTRRKIATPRLELCSAAFHSVEKHAFRVRVKFTVIFYFLFQTSLIWLILFDSLPVSLTNSELRLVGSRNNQDYGKLRDHMSAQPRIPVIIYASQTTVTLLASSLKTYFLIVDTCGLSRLKNEPV